MTGKQRRKAAKALLKDLAKASNLLHGVAGKAQKLYSDSDHCRFIASVGEALSKVFDLEAELFDLEPALTYDFLKPSLTPIDLGSGLERLLSSDSAIRHSAIQGFKHQMLDEVATEFGDACESGTGHEFAQVWWQRQKKPFIPVVRVYKGLRQNRRYLRYQSAKALEEEFGVRLWNNEKGDVLLGRADEWFTEWLTH